MSGSEATKREEFRSEAADVVATVLHLWGMMTHLDARSDALITGRRHERGLPGISKRSGSGEWSWLDTASYTLSSSYRGQQKEGRTSRGRRRATYIDTLKRDAGPRDMSTPDREKERRRTHCFP
ncbi:hypothetical protein Bbelb_074110 [Branchiostoma belcheri]|nr:hypothetical protein Bbelb_074110 [Branchiostoma belcheri]